MREQKHGGAFPCPRKASRPPGQQPLPVGRLWNLLVIIEARCRPPLPMRVAAPFQFMAYRAAAAGQCLVHVGDSSRKYPFDIRAVIA